MRIMRILAFFCICFIAISAEQKNGDREADRVMVIGGESRAGPLNSIPQSASMTNSPFDRSQFVRNEEIRKPRNKQVKATGAISHRHGVERGERSILDVSSSGISLTGSEWLLEDLAGAGVIDTCSDARFPEGGKVSGKDLHRFFGPAKIDGNAIQLGPLGSTRMACPEAS